MTRFDVDAMSKEELTALHKAVTKTLKSYDDRKKAEVQREVAELVESHGFKLSDLFAVKGQKAKGAPKYANPEDPTQTWTGKGRKPNWLVDRLEQGKKLEDFAI